MRGEKLQKTNTVSTRYGTNMQPPPGMKRPGQENISCANQCDTWQCNLQTLMKLFLVLHCHEHLTHMP